MALSMQADQWQTPASDSFRSRGGDRKDEMGLDQQARTWPGPMAHEARLGYQQRPEHLVGSQQSLWTIAVDWSDDHCPPPSSPAPPIAGGSTSSTDSPNSNQPSVKRKLNPIFVEALMRWPTGLSGFERQETAWTRWWLLMPSYLSTLLSPPTQQQESLF